MRTLLSLGLPSKSSQTGEGYKGSQAATREGRLRGHRAQGDSLWPSLGLGQQKNMCKGLEAHSNRKWEGVKEPHPHPPCSQSATGELRHIGLGGRGALPRAMESQAG